LPYLDAVAFWRTQVVVERAESLRCRRCAERGKGSCAAIMPVFVARLFYDCKA